MVSVRLRPPFFKPSPFVSPRPLPRISFSKLTSHVQGGFFENHDGVGVRVWEDRDEEGSKVERKNRGKKDQRFLFLFLRADKAGEFVENGEECGRTEMKRKGR